MISYSNVRSIGGGADGLTLGETDRDTEGLTLGEGEIERDTEGLTLGDGEIERDTEGDTDALALTDALADIEGLTLAEPLPP